MNRIRRILPPLLLAGGIAGAWELGVQLRWIDPLYFPAPSVILAALGGLLASGLIIDLGWTLGRLLFGVIAGGTVGLLLGMLLGVSKGVRSAAEPLIGALHPIPKVAVLPLVLLLMGMGDGPIVVLIAVTAFFPMVLNTMEGVRGIPLNYFEVARNYGAGRLLLFRRVLLPGSLPVIVAGAKMAVNTGFVVGIAAEILIAPTGLGARIWHAWQIFRPENLYAILVLISALGYLLSTSLNRLHRRFSPWDVG